MVPVLVAFSLGWCGSWLFFLCGDAALPRLAAFFWYRSAGMLGTLSSFIYSGEARTRAVYLSKAAVFKR